MGYIAAQDDSSTYADEESSSYQRHERAQRVQYCTLLISTPHRTAELQTRTRKAAQLPKEQQRRSQDTQDEPDTETVALLSAHTSHHASATTPARTRAAGVRCTIALTTPQSHTAAASA